MAPRKKNGLAFLTDPEAVRIILNEIHRTIETQIRINPGKAFEPTVGEKSGK